MSSSKIKNCSIYFIIFVVLLWILQICIVDLNDLDHDRNVIININTFDLVLLESQLKKQSIFIVGVVSLRGYHLAKTIAQNFTDTNIIALDSFDVKHGSQIQRVREQELIRLSVNVIRGNVCDEELLSEIVNDNKQIQMIIIAHAATHKCGYNFKEYYMGKRVINASSLINITNIGSNKRKKGKRNLLMTTFYVTLGDPMRRPKIIQDLDDFSLKYNMDFYWGIKFIEPWIKTFKNVSYEHDTWTQTDIVIIHDGIKKQIFERYPSIIFVNMAQYPKKDHLIRSSANDIRYYHFAAYLNQSDDEYDTVLITDLRDVKFGRDPFEFLKLNLKHNVIYVGSELENKVNKTMYWRWENHMLDRMKVCFRQNTQINKNLHIKETKDWMLSEKGIKLNPGIIASHKNTVLQLLNVMKQIFTYTKRARDNCNFVVYQVAIYNLCIVHSQCIILNDESFHSQLGLNENPSNAQYAVYHK